MCGVIFSLWFNVTIAILQDNRLIIIGLSVTIRAFPIVTYCHLLARNVLPNFAKSLGHECPS